MDNLVSLLKAPYTIDPKVEAKLLELIQTWASAFEGQVHLSYTNQIYHQLQTEHFRFPPPTKVSSNFVDSSAVRCPKSRTHASLLLTTSISHLIGRILTFVCAAELPSPSRTGNTTAGIVGILFVELVHQSRYLCHILGLSKLFACVMAVIPN